MIYGSKIKLRDKRLSDALNDYSWQTDAELAQLDAVPSLAATFPQFLIDYASELRYSPSTRHWFAIETTDDKHIGNCGFYNIDEIEGKAELGIMIGDRDHWDRGYGTDVVSTMLSYVFQQTNSRRIYLKTLEANSRARRCFQKCGFIPYEHSARDGFNFVLMEIHRKQWQEQQKGSLIEVHKG